MVCKCQHTTHGDTVTVTLHAHMGLQLKQAEVRLFRRGGGFGRTVKWFIAAAVGVLMGFIASIVDWIILAVDSWRLEAAHYLLGHHRGSDGDARAFFAYMAVALAMAAAAATICAFVEPLAAGSGIPVGDCAPHLPSPECVCSARGVCLHQRAFCPSVAVHPPCRPTLQELKTYLNGVHIPSA